MNGEVGGVEAQAVWLRWIVLLPLLSAALQCLGMAVLGRPLGRRLSAGISCASLGVAFVVGFLSLLELVARGAGATLVDDVFTWIGAGRLQLEAELALDPLAATLVLLVSGIGALVHAHGAWVMAGDDREDAGHARFTCLLDLLAASMLLLALAGNLGVFLVGWQGVGVCLHLLVGFWYLDARASRGALRLGVVQLLGDGFLLLAILLLFHAAPEHQSARLDFRALPAALPALEARQLDTPVLWSAIPGVPALGVRVSAASAVALALVLAALCRAAQLPFSFWVRALVPAPPPARALSLATLGLGSGVVLLLRVPALLAETPTLSLALSWAGAATALLAACAAARQRELHCILVWLALVQLGLATLAVGLGAYAAALFHLVTQAAVLATLCGAAAAVGRALGRAPSEPLLLDGLGGLWRALPRTHLAFACGVAAVVGVPFSSGFFSRDQVLLAAGLAEVPGRVGLQATALLASGLAAFVATRTLARVFHGQAGLAEGRLHALRERGGLAAAPLLALAFLALFVGWLGPSSALNPFPVPGEESNSLANFVAPGVPGLGFDVSHGTERRLALVGVGLSLGFAWLAWRTRSRERLLPGAVQSGWARVAEGVRGGPARPGRTTAPAAHAAHGIAEEPGAEGAPRGAGRDASFVARAGGWLRSAGPEAGLFFALLGVLALLLGLAPA